MQNSKLKTTAAVYSIRSLDEISESMLQSWRELCINASQKNVFLSPEFVIPSVKCFALNLKLLMIWEREESTSRLVGFVIVESKKSTRLYPFAHLNLYHCPYSFLSGVLLLPGYAELLVDSLALALKNGELGATALSFTNVSRRQGTQECHKLFIEHPYIHCLEHSSVSRAVLDFDNRTRSEWRDKQSKSRRKDIARKQRSLETLGEISWCYISDADLLFESLENFLRLEHMGWKGEAQTSLRSNVEHEMFIIDVVENLGSRQVFFTELLLDGEVIASSLNFKYEGNVFAFKSGYNPDYAKYSVGMLNEVYLLRHFEGLDDVNYCDSGSVEGSYMDSLWTDRDTLYSGIWVTTPIIKGIAEMFLAIRRIKNQFT